MSSFFSSASSYKPQAQIRQEGFHPDHPSNTTPPPANFDLFNPFLPPDSFRKFPPGPSPAMDFSDELASLIQDRSDDRYHRPPHNIFDISAPNPEPQSYPPHFNQTLPALNSSLRYENEQQQPPPSSFHHFTRHTPSPHPGHSRSRSRSRPPSSGTAPPTAATASSIGPARTTRSRRNNSVSGTSPPPGRPHAIVIPRSRAATVSGNANGTAAGWFMQPGQSEFSLPTPDSLTSHHSPHLSHAHTHSLSSHLSHSPAAPSPAQAQYSPFSLSPPPDAPNGLHLPALHSLNHHPHPPSYLHNSVSLNSGSPHSLPNLGVAIPSIPPLNTDSRSPTSPTTGSHDKQALLANEKRRRRRESHNAVERRRRDNINEKISELATLIPECLLDVGVPSNAPNPAASPPTDDPSSPLDCKKEVDPTNHSGSGTPETTPAVAAAATTTAGSNTSTLAGADGLGVVKANKGMILRKSVEYIRYLQQLVEAQGARNRELEAELKAWRGASASPQSDGGLGMMYTASTGGGNGAGSNFFGLPTMPEGEDEGDEVQQGQEMGMEGVLEEGPQVAEKGPQGRGRTRGVNGVGKGGGRKKASAAAAALVKEEGGPVEEMMVL